MEISISNEKRNNEATKWGVIMGVIALAYMFIGYGAGISVMVNTWYFIMAFVIPIILLCVGVVRLRNSNNGFITFKDAFLYLLIVSLISSLIYILGQYVLYNIIDENIGSELRKAVGEKILDRIENSGMSPEEKEELILQSTKNMQFDMLSLLKSYLTSLVSLTVLNLIISAIVKRTPKEEIM